MKPIPPSLVSEFYASGGFGAVAFFAITLAADLGHVRAVTAHRDPALGSCHASFVSGPLVRAPLLVSSFAARARDLGDALLVHHRESHLTFAARARRARPRLGCHAGHL
jgi:hypothetical protein